MSSAGHLALQTETTTSPDSMTLVILAVPDLKVEGQCHYAGNDENGVCGEMLSRIIGSTLSLQEYIETLQDAYGLPVRHAAPKPECPSTGVTRDRRFTKESCEKHHLSTWNRNSVIGELKENIISLDSGKQVGTVQETTRNSTRSHFADQNGRNYVLVMEGGTKLKVYEISP